MENKNSKKNKLKEKNEEMPEEGKKQEQEQEQKQNKLDKKFMKEALKQAKKAKEKNEIPIGAVIVKDGKILSKAYNKKEKKSCSIYHAEMIAIDKACKKLGKWRLEDATIYVTLEPCPMCASAIILSRIKRVVYALKDEKTGSIDSKIKIRDYDLYHDFDVTSGILENESKEIIQNFFRDLREKKKK